MTYIFYNYQNPKLENGLTVLFQLILRKITRKEKLFLTSLTDTFWLKKDGLTVRTTRILTGTVCVVTPTSHPRGYEEQLHYPANTI